MIRLVAFAFLLLLPLPQAAAESNSCQYAYDGECDEPSYCSIGTDAWDCRRAGGPPGPGSCRSAGNGICDEPGGTGQCLPGSDRTDCAAAGIGRDFVFFGRDDRVWPDSREAPWRMIGRLTFVSGGSCTATLVAPDIILTAAHCLFEEEGAHAGALDRPLQFLAGATGQEGAVARANVIAYFVAPRFDVVVHLETSDLDGEDWAILKLDRRIGDETGWMNLAPMREGWLRQIASGRAVMQAGYSMDSPLFLSANIACRITEIWDDNTFFHRCDTLDGDSGSPIFFADGPGWQVIGIHSALYPGEDGAYQSNMAVDIRAFGWVLAEDLPWVTLSE